MYSIDDLRTFVAIADTRGVTSGARRIGISPATASHRLNKLETALTLSLFHRSSRTLTLTDAGRIFLERTQRILADLSQAELDAGSGRSELVGHLRVTLSPWILSRFILPALPAFQRTHPKLTCEFLAVDRFVSLSAEGQDCAIRVGNLPDSAMLARKLADNERIVCAAPNLLERHGHPKDLAAMMAFPWVCLPWQRRIAFRDERGRRKDRTIDSSILVSNSDILTDAAVRGLGLAIKSRLAVRHELNAGQLVEIQPGCLWEPDAPIWFVFMPEGKADRKIRLFNEAATNAFKRTEP